MRGHGKTEDKVYQFVCSNPGMNTYEISKRLGMSGGNVRNALSNLHKKSLVKFKFVRSSPRTEKQCFAVKLWSLMPRALRRKIKGL